MGFSPRFTISSTLMVVFTLFCITVIISISYVSYSETSKNIISSFNREEKASENLFLKSSIYIHKGMKLWDSTYDKILARDMNTVLLAYNRTGGHPELLNIPEIISLIDPLYRERINFYFINSSGVIEYTTDENEHLFDFSPWPEFIDEIKNMMMSDEFVPDEIVNGFTPGSPLRKFVYQSTPDHRYLVEIGLQVQNDSVKERAQLSYGNLASYVLRENPKLTKLHLINFFRRIVIGNADYPGRKLDSESKKNVDSVFLTHERILIRDPVNQTETVYIFIPNAVEDTPSADYMNLVGKFVFSTEELNNQLNYNLILHLLLVILASSFALLIVVLITKRLTSPINTLVNEIDQIAQGNFGQEISKTGHPELKRIADAVRTMVNHINGTIWELQASESRFRNLFNTATDGILIVENDLIINANPVAESLFSNNSVALSGMYLMEICPPVSEFVSEFQNRFYQPESSSSTASEADIKISDGGKTARTMNVRTVPLGSGEHPLFQVQIRDVTKRIEMEERLRDLNASLEEQVKERTASLEATISDLDSFAYTVSHDLRAPLRAIDGNAHILEMKGHGLFTPDLHRHVNRIHENIKKMDDLINGLLNFSRMSRKPLEKTEIDMNQLVADVMNELCSSECVTQITIRIGSLPNARGDITLVRQVLINLFLNALKFRRPGTLNEITISSRIEEGKTW